MLAIDTALAALPIGASGGSSFLVSPDLGLMIWTLVVFLIALAVLAKFAFPRISKELNKRQQAIEETIDTAERTREEADALLAEYRESLKQAREQAEEIVARARKAADQAEQESLGAAREQRDEILAQAKRDVEAETRRAIQEIRGEVADLTVLATEKVTRKVLTAEDQDRLVEEALSELDLTALAGNDK